MRLRSHMTLRGFDSISDSRHDLVLTGRVINAEEAGAIGLVSRVLPAASFDADVEAVLAGLSRSSATALALTKWLLYKLDALSFEDGIAAGIVTNVEARATEDFRAAVRRQLGGGTSEPK